MAVSLETFLSVVFSFGILFDDTLTLLGRFSCFFCGDTVWQECCGCSENFSASDPDEAFQILPSENIGHKMVSGNNQSSVKLS